MVDDGWDSWKVFPLGLVLVLAATFIPELMASPWLLPPPTSRSIGAVPDTQTSSEMSLAQLATLSRGVLADGCRSLGLLAPPHDQALAAAKDAIIGGALSRKAGRVMGDTLQDPLAACSCEGPLDWRSSMAQAPEGSFACAASP